jgi:hypothetical protein
MPKINKYECNNCWLSFPGGWGGYMYVIENSLWHRGRRRACGHPCEEETVYEVLGKDASQKLIEARTGYNSYCVCQSCLQQFALDIGDDEKVWSWRRYYAKEGYGALRRRDKRKCPYCKSKDVKTVMELVGQPCPKCKEGTIQEIWTKLVS